MTIRKITVLDRPNIFWNWRDGEPITFAGAIAVWAGISVSAVTRFYPRACTERRQIVLSKDEIDCLNVKIGRDGRLTAISISDFDRLALFLASRSSIAKEYTGGQTRQDGVMPTGCAL